MKYISLIAMALVMVSLPACGNKGKLKSPAQIEQIKAKKARQEAKQNQKDSQQETDNTSEPTSCPFGQY